MDAPTPRPWGLGLRPSLRLNLPPSFIIFFPSDSTTTTIDGKSLSRLIYTNCASFRQSWVGVLQAPIPLYREPAWHRVATEYLPPNSNVTRIIMRRISIPNPRAYQTCFISDRKEIAAMKEIQRWTEPTKCKMPSKKKLKLNSFRADDSLPQFCGRPDSRAAVAQMLMAAKVNLINGLMEIPRHALDAEVVFIRALNNRWTTPMQRRIDKNDCIEQDGLFGGYRMPSYLELLPLFRKAAKKGDSRITLLEASIAEVAACFKHRRRRSPRVRISLLGTPGLPAIVKVEEPVVQTPSKKSNRAPLCSPHFVNPLLGEAVDMSTPRLAPSQFQRSPQFNFEPSSPSFASPNWLHPDTVTSRAKEALVRTPEKSTLLETTSTPAISWGEMNGRGNGVQSTPGQRVAHMTGVHTVDMRQNPDIFGAPANTSSMPSPSAIDRLADMAVDRCDGQAKVQVSEENGRLIVRFKLPTEYAHLFPNSQVVDASRFSATPSAISSKPRITAADYELNLVEGSASPQVNGPNWPGVVQPEGDTLIMSDFETSPTPSWPGVVQPEGDTLIVSDIETSPTPSWPSMVQHEGVTLILSDFDTLPTPGWPSVLQPEGDTLIVSEFETLPTPSGRGIEGGHPTLHLHGPAQSRLDEDSPGRDYMRDFIKRTHRKRLSTETGSPIAPPAKRAPLGFKSPNVDSPRKGKRKADHDMQDVNSPVKTTVGPLPKKVRQVDQLTSEIKPVVIHQSQGSFMKVGSTGNGNTNTNDGKDDEKMEKGSGARRSTRLRSQQLGPATKSSIPTSIKLGGRPSGGRLNPTARNDEKELSSKTRRNTLKNRGNAEYPAQVLARYQEEQLRGASSSEDSDEPQAPSNVAESRKCVEWKTPLEAHQGDDANKTRIATVKSKNTAKPGSSGIAKLARKTTAQKQQHTAKVAATLGMSQNGTPAKPSRVTRSSARARA